VRWVGLAKGPVGDPVARRPPAWGKAAPPGKTGTQGTTGRCELEVLNRAARGWESGAPVPGQLIVRYGIGVLYASET